MFKKRTRPASVRDKQVGEDDSPAPGTSGTNTPLTDTPGDEDSEIGYVEHDLAASIVDSPRQNIEEMIMLRKLRKSKQGIDIEKLNRGEEKKKAKKAEPEIDLSKFGLQPSVRKTEPAE